MMSFIGRLFGQPSQPQTRDVIGIDVATFTGRRRKLEIVGEYYHQQDSRKFLGTKARDGINLTVVSALVPDPNHTEDSHTVGVYIDGYLVGYLSREQALGYHRALKVAGNEGRAVGNIEALIFGRPLDRDGIAGFGVATCT